MVGRESNRGLSESVSCQKMQQQGHEVKAQALELPWPACHAAKVLINTLHSANPDLDRQPTGQFAIHACKTMAHIHRPNGTYAGNSAGRA